MIEPILDTEVNKLLGFKHFSERKLFKDLTVSELHLMFIDYAPHLDLIDKRGNCVYSEPIPIQVLRALHWRYCDLFIQEKKK